MFAWSFVWDTLTGLFHMFLEPTSSVAFVPLSCPASPILCLESSLRWGDPICIILVYILTFWELRDTRSYLDFSCWEESSEIRVHVRFEMVLRTGKVQRDCITVGSLYKQRRFRNCKIQNGPLWSLPSRDGERESIFMHTRDFSSLRGVL